MTKKNGLPCKRCGTSEWNSGGACKQCQKNWWKSPENEAKIRAYREKDNRYDARRDYLRDYNKRWRTERPEYYAELLSRWRRNNPGYMVTWYERNRESKLEKDRVYATNNPEKRLALVRRYRARKRGSEGDFSPEEWESLCEAYGNICLGCKRGDIRLTADHVIPLSKGGANLISNIQPLCQGCNSRKGTKSTDYRKSAPEK